MPAENSDRRRHEFRIEFIEVSPDEVDAGTDLTVAVGIRSSSGLSSCDVPLVVAGPDGVRLTGKLSDFIAGEETITRFVLRAPDEVGEFVWRFLIPSHECHGARVDEVSHTFAFKTRAHLTSLAVWDHPSPIIVGEVFKVKVGAQCSAGCPCLPHAEIEILDSVGDVIATRRLGETAWPDTDALYWAEIELHAPTAAGMHGFSARLRPAELKLPHREASFAFSLTAVERPEHMVSVTVVEQGTGKPLEDAQVRLGAYRAATDETGLAHVNVTKGEHELFVWKAGYEVPTKVINVRGDIALRLEATLLPVIDPDSYWQG